MTENKHTDIDETVKLEVEQTTEMPVASIDEEATISSTDNSPASGEDPTTRIEVAETTELPVSSVEEASEELPETKAYGTTEEESELPEPNFDPAEEPSAFDPRITGEYSPAHPSPAEQPAQTQAPTPTEPPEPSEVRVPEDAPSSMEAGAPNGQPQADPFAGYSSPEEVEVAWSKSGSNGSGAQEEGAENPFLGVESRPRAPQDPQPEPTTVKFGLLTWSLVLIAIGIMILAIPAWGMINWQILGTVALATMGVVMLVIAGLSARREKKSKNR